MKYETTRVFDGDVRRLSGTEFDQFRGVIRERFIPAAERRAHDPTIPRPDSLRIRAVANAPRVCELTWSFAGPDGRATFEWVTLDGEPAIRWRRVGGHSIFANP